MKNAWKTLRATLIRTIPLACVAGMAVSASVAQTYVDCGMNCADLALGKDVSASGLWNPTGNPASKVNDGNTGTTSACEGASGYCAIASDTGGSQAVGNYLQIDLGSVLSVKSVTVYGRRDTALTQGQNLNLKLSSDGTSWTTTYMPDTTSASGLTVSTARVARYVRVETTTVVYLSLYEIVVTGTPPAVPGTYVDCGTNCTDLAIGKTASASGLWNPTGNPASKVNDGNTGTTSECEGSAGYCAIASDTSGGQAMGNYLQVDLGAVMSVKSVTVYGRRDTAFTQGQNLNLLLSADGITWSTTYMPDTTSVSGLTVSTARLARYVKVETTAVVYLSLYEIVVTGTESTTSPPPLYVDCGGSCSNLALGKRVTATGEWNSATNPVTKANDGNTGTDPLCEGPTGYCAIASDPNRRQAVGTYLKIDLGVPMSVKNVTVYGRRDAALTQGQNLDLKLSKDGAFWTTTFMADTTSASGLTVPTEQVARYIKVVTTTVNYLSLYEVVVTGTPATGYLAPPEGAQSNPCVENVPAAFAALREYGDTLQVDHNNVAPDYQPSPTGIPSNSHHFQGIQRLRAPGNYFALSGAEPGEIFIGRMGSRNPLPGSPWSSNFLTNLAIDKLLGRYYVGANHVGGLSVIGNYIAMPMQSVAEGPATQVSFLDVTDPAAPVLVPNFATMTAGRSNLGAVAITKLPSGKFLLGAHNTLSAQTLDWYVSTGSDLRTTGWNFTGTNVLIAGYQNINLINQCDGHVYMIGTFDQAICGGWCGDDRRMRLYDIAMSGDTVTNVGQIGDKQMQCGTAACEFAAAAGVYVTPGGSLLAYSSRGYVAGDILQFAEFQQIPTPIEVETTQDAWAMYWKDAGLPPSRQSMAMFFYDPNWFWYSMNDGFGYGSLDGAISSLAYSVPPSHELILFSGNTMSGTILLRLTGPGTYDNLANNGINDQIRSAWFTSKGGGFIHVFDGANFVNRFTTNLPFTAGAQSADMSNVWGANLNNKISSIRYRGTPGVGCFFYHDVNFVNQCGTIGDTGGAIVEVPIMSTSNSGTMKCADNQISSYRCARTVILHSIEPVNSDGR